MRNTLMTMIAT